MSHIYSPLLLVGSLPLGSSEDALRAGAEFFGDLVFALPDGETGPRSRWVGYEAFTLLARHPSLVPVPSPETAIPPRHLYELERYRLKPGTTELRWEAWPRIEEALSSYKLFTKLRADGVIPAGLRFQVGLPLPFSVLGKALGEDPGEYAIAVAGYEELVSRELARLTAAIPAEDLAIQWDIANEILDIEGVMPHAGPGGWERFAGPAARLIPLVPEDALMGLHLCYGTFPEWPMYEPRDMSVLVRMANHIVATAGRPVDWLHLAGPRYLRSEEDGFFKPLADLEAGEARVYLGIVLPVDGIFGLRRRHATASRYLDDFGVSMYCGFGRHWDSDAEALLRQHRDTVIAHRSAS